MTFQNTRSRLKRTTNIYTARYQHSLEKSIHGPRQGSGNSPQIWCFICNALFKAYEEKATGADFISFDGKEKEKVYMIGFVDDCSQRINHFSTDPQPDAGALTQEMSTDVQLWRDLLFASGGDLELPKCFFQVIQSDFKTNGTPFLRGGHRVGHAHL